MDFQNNKKTTVQKKNGWKPVQYSYMFQYTGKV